MTHTLVVVLVASYLCLIVALLGLVWHERWRGFKAGAECAMAPVVEDPTPLEEEPLVVDPEPTLREKLLLAGLGPLTTRHTCGPQCTPPTGPVLQDRWRVHTACFDAYADRLPARVCEVCAPVLLGVPR